MDAIDPIEIQDTTWAGDGQLLRRRPVRKEVKVTLLANLNVADDDMGELDAALWQRVKERLYSLANDPQYQRLRLIVS